MKSAKDCPAFDKKFDIPPEPYPSVPGVEQCERAARYKAMEKYGSRQDVYDMLFRYLNDLLTTQPEDSLEFMLKWASKEVKNPHKLKPPVEVDRSIEKYNLSVNLKSQDTHDGKKKRKEEALKGKR